MRRQIETHVLILVTLGLVAFGLVMVYSATSAPAAVGNGDPSSYLKRQAAYAVVGVVLMLAVSRLGLKRLRLLAPTLLATSLVLLAAVLVLGQSVNGARRWIAFGPVTFQPSELAKLALAVWAASYLARKRAPATLKELLRPFGILVAVFGLLLLAEPDLGTAISIVLMLAVMLFVSGTPLRALSAGIGILTALALAAIWLEPYRRERVFSFLNPWDDAQGAGFQTVQAMISFGSGGFFGVGLARGVAKIFYLPEAHTDMILAVIGEELGLVGTLAVVAAFAVFVYAALRVALTSSDPFGKRLAAGLSALVCGQAAINLAAVLGLAPLTGIPLPFVSYGGSSLVVSLVAVGLLLNIAAGGGEQEARMPDRGRRDRGARGAGAGGRAVAERPRRARDVRRVARPARGAAGP